MASAIILSDNGVSSGSAGLKEQGGNDGVLILQTTTSGGTATNAVTIDTSQNVGIGTSSPTSQLSVQRSAATPQATLTISDFATPANDIGIYMRSTVQNGISWSSGAYLAFYRGGPGSTESARFDSSGNLLVGDTSTLGAARGYINAPSGSNGWTTKVQNNTNVLFNGYNSSGTQIFYVKGDGGIANYSANNLNLSDERTKTEIVDAGSYLDKICAIPVKTFKYKNQEDDLLNLGVIAQEVEIVAPELVDASGFGETPEDGVPLKAIYQTDLQYALMKCIQEQQALITTLTERITALEAK